MAKDDMSVIVYKILRYMYACMKAGVQPDMMDMCYACKMFQIPRGYWNQIVLELIDNGYGKEYYEIIQLLGANGKFANVLTAWILDDGAEEIRLTSAYVTRRKVAE